MSAPVTVGGCTLHLGDCREVLPALPAESVHCCVTSPPYWGLRDYGHGGQIGLEASVAEYVEALVGVFREVRRVLRPDGTLWLNLGDAYSDGGTGANSRMRNQINANWDGGRDSKITRGTLPPRRDGLKPKDLIGLPWRVAFALQADGWFLRSDVVWSKLNPMPESVTDRPTKSHEYVFMLTKSGRYFFDAEAVREPHVTGGDGRNRADFVPSRERNVGGRTDGLTRAKSAMTWPEGGRNVRSVWTIATQPFAEAHFATMPPELAERCVKAGCPVGGTVLDPFGGAGTTGLVADRLQRRSVLVELNPTYRDMAARRIAGDAPLLAGVAA